MGAKSIYLIGPRGAGKTTIGLLLAETVKTEFYDTDQIICTRQQCSIAEMVSRGGWEQFRRLEAEALESCLEFAGVVIATGGGAVMHRQVWEEIKQRGIIVLLSAPLETLIKRISGGGSGREDRPSLTGGNVTDEFKEVLREREPLYERLAHHVIDTGSLDRTAIVADIVNVTGFGKKVFKNS